VLALLWRPPDRARCGAHGGGQILAPTLGQIGGDDRMQHIGETW
jgi:hypothetical protein